MKIRGCLVGKIARKRLDRVAGEDEGRGRACIALPRAGNRTRPGQPGATQTEDGKSDRRRKKAAGSGGSKCETGRCQSPGRWFDAPINDLETLTRLDASAAQSMSASLRKRPKCCVAARRR